LINYTDKFIIIAFLVLDRHKAVTIQKISIENFAPGSIEIFIYLFIYYYTKRELKIHEHNNTQKLKFRADKMPKIHHNAHTVQ